MRDMPPFVAHHPLTYLLHQRSWNYVDLAEEIRRQCGLNMAAHKTKIYRWVRGRTTPEMAAQLAMATIFGVDPALVTRCPWPAWLATVDGIDVGAAWNSSAARVSMAECVNVDMDRRTFLLLTADAATGLAAGWVNAPPAEKISRTLQGSTSVDGEIADWIEARVSQLWYLDDLIGGRDCLSLAQAELQLVSRLLSRSSHREAIELRLYAMAGELYRFAGWSAFDAGYHAASERYWHTGLRVSSEAGDVLTGAYILSQMGMQRIEFTDGLTAINLLQAAREKIGRGASRTVHAMLDAWQVRAHAIVGEKKSAIRTLERAENHWEQRDAEEDPAWIYWMRRPSTTIEVGKALVALGQPEEAVRLLEEGMKEREQDGEFARDTALGLVAVADALYEAADFDSAIVAAMRVVEVLPHLGSTRIFDHLLRLSSRLPGATADDLQDSLKSMKEKD